MQLFGRIAASPEERCPCWLVGVAAGCFIWRRTSAAWGYNGHAHITAERFPHLPQPLRSFFQVNKVIRSQAANEPPGRHYIDIDVYPEFAAGTFPHDVNDLIAIYGESYVESNGMGPWTYNDYVSLLTWLMSNAKTNQDWLAMVPTAGARRTTSRTCTTRCISRNTTTASPAHGVHSRYESTMVNAHLADLTFAAAPAEYVPSIIESVFASIDVHHPFVANINNANIVAVNASGGSYNSTYYNSCGIKRATSLTHCFRRPRRRWRTAGTRPGSTPARRYQTWDSWAITTATTWWTPPTTLPGAMRCRGPPMD